MRARIDVSEIEAKTKIRAKYLRALENEEWDLLPGPTFVRSFLRTYAQALDLDGKTLVEEYRLRFEPPSEVELQPVIAGPRRLRTRPASNGGASSSRGYILAIGGVSVLIVLLLVGLVVGKGGSSPAKSSRSHQHLSSGHIRGVHASSRTLGTTAEVRPVALSFTPTAPVYICLIGDNGRKLIPGLIIQPPYTPITYRASHFDVTLGNNAVTLNVDGKTLAVPSSSQAIGYSITKSGHHLLAPGEMPTCE